MNDFSLIEQFIKDFLIKIGFKEEAAKFKITENNEGFKISSDILQLINNFMYVVDPSIGRNPEYDKDFISKFHKFWKENHEGIIAP